MSYEPMTEPEIDAFLRSPVRPGILATVRADGRPHVAPVWFDVDGTDGSIVFNTGADTVKGRNLARTGRAALCVQDDRAPFSYCSIEGTVSLSDDLDEVRAWAGRIGGRYMGADQAEAYGARNGVPGELVVRLRRDKVIAVRDVAL
jgi:PPOX class probable F420-dependent enzyme